MTSYWMSAMNGEFDWAEACVRVFGQGGLQLSPVEEVVVPPVFGHPWTHTAQLMFGAPWSQISSVFPPTDVMTCTDGMARVTDAPAVMARLVYPAPFQ